MYLQLSIVNGNGHISTIDDNEKSLVCKPVSAEEVSKMAQEYSLNDDYVVGMESIEDGMNWIVEDKNNPRKLMEAQRMSIQQSAKKNDDSKQSLEFSRYKQDCRKRALDLAHLEIQRTGSVDIDEIYTLANKYYKWLISIPE